MTLWFSKVLARNHNHRSKLTLQSGLVFKWMLTRSKNSENMFSDPHNVHYYLVRKLLRKLLVIIYDS